MVHRNIIKLTKHIFSKYLGKHLYIPMNVIPRNKFGKLEINTPLKISVGKSWSNFKWTHNMFKSVG